jgi:hypothetical protein
VSTKEYRDAHRETLRENSRRWRRNNVEHNKELQRQYIDRRKQMVVDAYGGRCACCGETELRFLSIDHINNDGADHRRELKSKGGFSFYLWLQRQGFPKDNFQCLCMNCNFGKLRTGICPHQEKGK